VSETDGISDGVYIHKFIGRPRPGPEVARADLAKWGLVPVQAPLAIPRPERLWSEDDWAKIQSGHESLDMDDKWLGFVENDCLYLHRSWTGRGIYEATFASVPAGWKIMNALVTSDSSNYRPSSNECQSLFLEVIIETVFLGEWSATKLERVVRCLRQSSRR
jgi:hypothetical protein